MVDSTRSLYKFSRLSDPQNDVQIPEKSYNINNNHFLRVDKSVPFDLDEVYFTSDIREDGIYFKICKEKSNRPVITTNLLRRQGNHVMDEEHSYDQL